MIRLVNSTENGHHEDEAQSTYISNESTPLYLVIVIVSSVITAEY